MIPEAKAFPKEEKMTFFSLELPYCQDHQVLFYNTGIGKTTVAHLVANTEGFDAIEFNASDTRNKSVLDVIFFNFECFTRSIVI